MDVACITPPLCLAVLLTNVLLLTLRVFLTVLTTPPRRALLLTKAELLITIVDVCVA